MWTNYVLKPLGYSPIIHANQAPPHRTTTPAIMCVAALMICGSSAKQALPLSRPLYVTLLRMYGLLFTIGIALLIPPVFFGGFGKFLLWLCGSLTQTANLDT
jgi:hypothetical protein